MKIIKVRVVDFVTKEQSAFLKEWKKFFKNGWIRSTSREIWGGGRAENEVDKNKLAKLILKYFNFSGPGAEKQLWLDKEEPLYTYRFYLRYPKGQSYQSNINQDRLYEAVDEINKKYPLGSGIRSRAGVEKKKGEFCIDVEIWNGPEERELDKDTFLPIIKKYFPNEKIRIYGAPHSRMGFSWYSYKYYILEK